MANSDNYQHKYFEIGVDARQLHNLPNESALWSDTMDPDPVITAQTDIIIKRLRQLYKKLTEHQQTVLALHLDGYTQVKIAKTIGISQSAVFKAIHGNSDYNNTDNEGNTPKYGGAINKLKKLTGTDPVILKALNAIRQYQQLPEIESKLYSYGITKRRNKLFAVSLTIAGKQTYYGSFRSIREAIERRDQVLSSPEQLLTGSDNVEEYKPPIATGIASRLYKCDAGDYIVKDKDGLIVGHYDTPEDAMKKNKLKPKDYILSSTNSSGYYGVTASTYGMYIAKYKQKYLGRFRSAEEASARVQKARQEAPNNISIDNT